jgi:hypothetical protein
MLSLFIHAPIISGTSRDITFKAVAINIQYTDLQWAKQMELEKS